MKNSVLYLVSVVLCGLPPAIWAAAADRPAALAAAAETSPARTRWPAENLSGRILSVELERHLVVVKDPDGVPFDMIVTPGSRIMRGNRPIAFKDLSRFRNEEVVIRFIPERRGDVVQWMRVGG